MAKQKREEINEHHLEHSQADDDTDDRQEHKTDERQDGGPDVKISKKDRSWIFYGITETQVSEEGEADLHKHRVDCKKNPDHKEFVPVNDFNMNHLPEGFHDNDLVEYIKATADITVMIRVKIISAERPEFWPAIKQPYPFYNMRGRRIVRVGTGMVRHINIAHDKGTCPCQKCKHSDTPSKKWAEVWMFTARHVVFDDLEARHASCRLFFDNQNSPLVTLDGYALVQANIDEDWCWFSCVTCDADLLVKQCEMLSYWLKLLEKVVNKHTSYENRLTWLVSHPHGCPKQISVGHWTERCVFSDNRTKYTYTACTCPGSSGAYVHSLGDGIGFLFGLHVHGGVNSEGRNFCGTGREFPSST